MSEAGGSAREPSAGAPERDSVETATVRHPPRRWIAAVLAVAFGLLYAFDLFEAISNLLGVAQLNGIAAEAGLNVPVPWVLPISTVVLPPLVYLLAALQ